MQIRIVRPCGFCQGVKRAVNITEDILAKDKGPKYCLGPIIHNKEVVNSLINRGLSLIYNLDQIKDKFATLILPSHGTSPSLIKKAKDMKLTLVDLICPYVLYVQRICQNLNKEGYFVIIVGDRNHPEIKALSALVKDALIVDKKIDLRDNNIFKIGIISQTTQSREKFSKVVNSFLSQNLLRFKEIRIFNTICPDVYLRQEVLKKLAKTVDIILVIGDRTSANTKRLVELSRQQKVKTYHIENLRDLDKIKIASKDLKIGITSGASTPDWLVNKIIKRIRGEFDE